jgi:hypothetical protein
MDVAKGCYSRIKQPPKSQINHPKDALRLVDYYGSLLAIYDG